SSDLAHAAFDHLFDDGFRLAGFAGLLDEDIAFTLGNRSIDFFGADRERSGRGDVHGNLTADGVQGILVAGRFQGDQNAELAETIGGSVVDVGRDDAVLDRQENRATQAHVFADGGNSVLDRVGNGLAGCRVGRGADGFDRAISTERYVGNAANDSL